MRHFVIFSASHSAEIVTPELLNTGRCFQRGYVLPHMNNSRCLPLEETTGRVKGGKM